MRTPMRRLIWTMVILVLYPLLLAGCSHDDTPKDPKIKAVWIQSQARREQRKAAGGL